MSQSQSRPGSGTAGGLGTAPTLTPSPEDAQPATRADVPVSVDDGIHPQLAVTAAGADEGDGEGAEPDAPDPWLGRVLSNVYRVESKIGEGGMGAVYLAKHVHLQKPYAIKVLSAAVAKHAQAVERLKQEAIAASSIEHDNIVDVVNFDRDQSGAVYIVMELLRGESLHARLGNGKLPVKDALGIAWQVCAALGAAHARGIVHRDLKPENVFLAKRGDSERVKVLDFGISKVKSADADGVRMTRTGQLVGTPLYMSPEQARGEHDIDLRVDVYALGVMLYEMLTGAPPFEGRNYFELLWKHGNEPPPGLRTKAPEVPEALERVVLRALAKSPGDRYQSMEALTLALEEACPDVIRASGGTSLPPEARRSHPGSGRADVSTSASAIPVAPPTTRPWLPIALVLGLVGAFAIAWATSSGGGTTETTEPPDTTGSVPGPPEPPPVPPPPTESVGDEPPAVVSVSFGSAPDGVEVRRGDEVLCTTPCIHDLPPTEAIELTFHRDGYLDLSRTVTPSDTPVVEVRLLPRRRPTDGTPVPGLKTKI